MTFDLKRGTVLALAIAQAAGRAGVPIGRFALPLSPSPGQWLKQLSESANPKPATIARIAALIGGQPVPPPPPNNFQASPRTPAHIRVAPTSIPIPVTRPIDRDPCFRCGVRGDIGCECGGRR